jgi:large subunit ribosomal protein L25
MASTTLVAHIGRSTGSAAARRLRTEGQIPGVLYGQGMDPITLAVERRELRVALSGSAGVNTVLDLEVDGKVYPAIVKELQRHPVRRTVSHVDFLQVNLNEEITVSVPVRIEGEAKAVVSNGGLVDPAVDSIDVVTTPRNIPDEVVVDISDMQMGDAIRLADIQLPAGVTAAGDPELLIVSVLTLRGATGADRPEGGESETAAAADDAAAGTADDSSDGD